jgi:hypothetical protein
VTCIGSFVLRPADIALLGGTSLVLVVNPKLPIRDLKSFTAYAATDKLGIFWQWNASAVV